ncbi:MAG: FAD-dependent monooxygenase [Microlunatus sp.]
MVIPKGGVDAIRAAGLPAFRRRLTATAPVLAPVVGSIEDWEQVRLLSVQVDRLPCWYRDGLICIGDAAHAMSPVGGVGVNFAIQDAVALANTVAGPLRQHGSVPVSALDAVQRRRARLVRPMQWIQQQAHARVGHSDGPRRRALPRPALATLKLLRPLVCRITARAVGRGFLPEHIAR